MTREEILALQPGRELDALVAEKVMGSKLIPNRRDTHQVLIGAILSWIPIPNYSTDISAAWRVVGEMQRLGHRLSVTEYDKGYYVSFDDIGSPSPFLPSAICKAALLAVLHG